MTLGDFAQAQADIASRWIHAGEKVLQLGYDTAQPFSNARRGADTMCIDHRFPLLRHISARARIHNLSLYMLAVQGKITAVPHICKTNHFDIVHAIMVFGMLDNEEKKNLLKSLWHLLKPDGTLISIEKKELATAAGRFFFKLIEIPLHGIVRLITGVTVSPVKDLEPLLAQEKFVIYEKRKFFFGALQVICAQKSLPD